MIAARWFMGKGPLKDHARPKARRPGAPPHYKRRMHTKTVALELLPRPTEVRGSSAFKKRTIDNSISV